ncbi:MAG: 2-amino-4-hydroxy-6-hydroxymethyldihydropteridine diphosphokinase [Planctomycetes bacterium GWF2_50_10]|nr:MAG: 2-amino-4-hydroxy-6-hydroxymethyldihydropteridine diphosphokinase [Planctomycetes bacterium GWF2_50_10]
MPNIAYIGLGSNLGERAKNLAAGIGLLKNAPGIEVLRKSSIYETLPLGAVAQPKYLNGVFEIATTLDPRQLLGTLLDIENKLGRVRTGPDNSRTIDLDLLLYADNIINEPGLVVPHPRMHLRSFVLKGLCELSPLLVHPLIKKTVAVLASRLNGGDYFTDFSKPQLIEMAGVIAVGKTTLASNLCSSLNARLIAEAYDTNPFLAKVYAGKHDLALDSQLYFLMTRVEQLSSIKPGEIAIADYVFEKEFIYAKRLLDAQQCDLYCRINNGVSGSIAQPSLLVYLKDTPQRCLERIHLRARPYEQKIEPAFLEELFEDYQALVAEWRISPVITITVDGFDCRDRAKTDELAKEIKFYLA